MRVARLRRRRDRRVGWTPEAKHLPRLIGSRNVEHRRTGPQGASRLIDSAGDLGVPCDAFLQAELPVINEEKLRVMHDLDGYVAELDESQARFVAEAKRRNVAAQAPEPTA